MCNVAVFNVKGLVLESQEREGRERRRKGGIGGDTDSGREGEGLHLCPGLWETLLRFRGRQTAFLPRWAS